MIKMLIMGKRCHINVRVFVCLLFVAVSNTEIHRAKPNPSKFSVKSTQSEDTSYVAEPNRDNLENWKVNMFDIRYETWFYAIFASILVGLSGIFPLLVIPIEAGPSLKHGAAAARLKLLLSFAVGGLLGDVFLHLLPEAWEHQRGGHEGSTAEGHRYLGLWIITGMLSFLIIEKIFAKEDEFEHLQDECLEAEEEEKYQNDKTCQPLHEHQTGSCSNDMDADCVQSDRSKQPSTSVHRNNKKQNILQNNNLKQRTKQNSASSANHKTKQIKSVKSTDNGISVDKSDKPSSQEPGIKVSGYLNLAANVIDNFTHGLAVAGGFLVNNKVGFITTLAILLHEIPHEIGDFAILLRSGFDRWKAAKAQLLTATGGMIGALTALTADSAQAAGERTLWVLPFTSGGFIYIALVTVVPDLMEEKHPRESTKQILCLLAGVGAMYLVSMVH